MVTIYGRYTQDPRMRYVSNAVYGQALLYLNGCFGDHRVIKRIK